MSKKALLVGINNFSNPLWRLRGCVNDTLAMRAVLTSYCGFQEADIKILHDKDADNRGIRDGLAWLLDGYTGQDVRLFHFSSHGTQVDDQSGDEWECMDEVIVPYDHDWTKPFRDDELRAIFQEIPEAVNFTFIADCCHSGSIQKELIDRDVDFKPRFLAPPQDVKRTIERKLAHRDAEADAWAAVHLAQMLQDVPQDLWVEKMQEYLTQLRRRFRENKYAVVPEARHILLAACEDRQTAADAYIDADFHGAFTWAICKAIKEAQGNLTYGELIACAGANLAEYQQRPQLECPAQLCTLPLFAPLA